MTEDLHGGRPSARARRLAPSLRDAAIRKLDLLDAATSLGDLHGRPGNRLEALRGDLSGHYSIRVNAQWRIVFRWTPLGPADVRLIDYH